MTVVARFADLIAERALEIGDGYRAKNSELGGDGPLFLRAAMLTVNGFTWSGERFKQSVDSSLRGKLGRPGDTVITTKGNGLGRTGYVPEGAPEFVYSPHLCFWRSLDDSRIFPGYLRYWANGPDFAAQLRGLAHGTDMAPYLSLADQKRLEISLPPIAEQRMVAEILGSLDAKVESNRRLSALIPRYMGTLILRAIEEDHDKIPVSSLGSFVNGGAFTKGASGKGRMVVRIAELNKGPGASTVYNDIDVPDDQTARVGDILMSWSGSLGVYLWLRDEAIINQHIFKVIPERYPPWLVFDRLNAAIDAFRGIARDKATTMGHIQRGHLDTTSVDMPSDRMVKVLDSEMRPLWDRLVLAELESLRLAALRDALLPALLSGNLIPGTKENGSWVSRGCADGKG